MLEFSALSVTLDHRDILTDISFAVKKGRITALLGKNGSGKTTLLRAVNQEIAYRGRIRIASQPTDALAPRERARHIALLPQILPKVDLTVGELIMLGRTPYLGLLSHPSSADREAVTTAMRDTGLLPLRERRVASLSGGERQRAYLAMLLAQSTPCILLDEPTTYLDADTRKQLLSLLGSLSRRHQKTVLAVLHDINDAIRIADDIALLAGGHLEFYGTVESFLEARLPETHFGLERHPSDGVLPFFY